MTVPITPLESWIREKAGIGAEPNGRAFADALGAYQLRKVNETLDPARANAPFYRRHLADLPARRLKSLSDLSRLPFTTPSDLAQAPSGFLSVPLDDVARIVTLRTSGTTGEGKRLFLTEEDLELTMDFFHHGMSALVQPGHRVMVFLPGDKPDSVGDLLVRGLARMDVDALAYGPVADPSHAAEAVDSFGAHCLVGIPTQVLSVARSLQGAKIGKGRIKSVLLSTDYVPNAIVRSLEKVWGCQVFNHYGMTETGLGGGVECAALDGYHLREADLYFEIIDRETGEPCPDGVTGEVVFTTLTRQGTPLIRYRTGDIARMIPEPCPCGTSLRRMDRVRGRWEGALQLGGGCILTLRDLDEALFRLPDLLDYRATVAQRGGGKLGLSVDVLRAEGGTSTDWKVLQQLQEVDSIRAAAASSKLEIEGVRFSQEGRWTTTGVAKRKILT